MTGPSDSSAPGRAAASVKPWEHAKVPGGGEDEPLAASFVASLDYDTRLYKQDIRGSIAHARMLGHIGLLNPDEVSAITAGLTQIEQEIDEQGNAWPGWKIELEDVHMCLEAALIERIGDPGRKLHTGRSRNDQVALDLQLWIEDAVKALDAELTAVFRAYVDLAQRQGETVMPAYTHLQRAQPIVLGGELLAWVEALDRARRRLHALNEVNRRSPLGSGAIAGTSLELDRQHTAEALGLPEVTPNSMDATSTRDAALDLLYGLCMIATTLSRWAEQWIIYSSTEFGFLTLDSRYTTGSSMMPQKQNPDMLELIRGRSGQVYGHLMGLLTTCKGLPLGYQRDLQEDKRGLFAGYDSIVACLQMTARVVASARFESARIEADLDRGFLDATSLAEYLVNRGVAFRTAHQVVGRCVALCQSTARPRLSDLTLAELQDVARQLAVDPAAFDGEVQQWLGPHNVVRRYRSPGNAGLSGFQAQLAAWRQRLSAVPG